MQVQLKVVNGRHAGQLIPINRPKFMIGRAEDCHLKPKNELISRYHCVLLLEEGYVGIRDLGSRNGVFVNTEKIDGEMELHNGDQIAVGPLEFEIVVAVAMSAGKKPKVESIADVVARTVEQSSLSGPGSQSGGQDPMVDWLLDESITAETSVSPAAAKQPTGTMKKSEEPEAPVSSPAAEIKPEPEPTPKPVSKPKPAAPVKKPEEKPVIPKTPPAAPGETANALKNFFKNR